MKEKSFLLPAEQVNTDCKGQQREKSRESTTKRLYGRRDRTQGLVMLPESLMKKTVR